MVPRGRLATWVWSSRSNRQFVARFSLANRRWRLPLQVAHLPDSDLLLASTGASQIWVARMERIRLQLGGVDRRAASLSSEYLLEHVDFPSGEWFVDVGANVGEVSRIVGERFLAPILAIEPEELEVAALHKNLYGYNYLLSSAPVWSEDAIIPWYAMNDTGDSSLILSSRATKSGVRAAERLDTTVRQYLPDDATIGLLKIEAEGAEPEALIGAAETLSRTRWVVGDFGPERGDAEESTVVPCFEILHEAGFRLIAFHQRRTSFLFLNRAFQAGSHRA